MPPANWKELFLDSLWSSPNVSKAARRAGIDRTSAYDHKREDEAFSREWDNAIDSAIDDLEESSLERAKAESDTLAIFFMKAHRRKLYGDQSKLELTGKNGGPVEVLSMIDKVYGDSNGDDPKSDGG